MRYAALVTVAEPADFGSYHMLARDTERVRARRSDERCMRWPCIFTRSNRRTTRTRSTKRQKPAKRFLKGRAVQAATPRPCTPTMGSRWPSGSRLRRIGLRRWTCCLCLSGPTQGWPWPLEKELVITRSVAEGRLVSRTLSPPRRGRQPGRDVRPGSIEGDPSAGRLASLRFEGLCYSRTRIRPKTAGGRTGAVSCVSTNAVTNPWIQFPRPHSPVSAFPSPLLRCLPKVLHEH